MQSFFALFQWLLLAHLTFRLIPVLFLTFHISSRLAQASISVFVVLAAVFGYLNLLFAIYCTQLVNFIVLT